MKSTTQPYLSVNSAAVVNTGRGAVGKRRNQAVVLATLSLKFSSKASGRVVREISGDAGLYGRRHV